MSTYKLIRQLPDAFRKDPESNNYKLLSVYEDLSEEFKADLADISASQDLEQATGKTLDLFGQMFDQQRGAMTDTQYRYLIKTKIGRNTVRGDYKSTLDAIVAMFNAKYDDVSLDDVEIEETDKPCVVKLTKMPVHILAGAGFTSTQAVQMIELLLPVCVTLEADNFEGTFCFSAAANEYDPNAGFSDENNIIGGYFGLLLGEDGNTPLPL